MNSQQLADLATNNVLRARLAKLMALECFRNSELQNLHAGKFPSSRTGVWIGLQKVTTIGAQQRQAFRRFSRLQPWH